MLRRLLLAQLWLAASVPTHFAHGGDGAAERIFDQVDVDLNAIASVVRGRDAATHRRHARTGALSTLLPLSGERMDEANAATNEETNAETEEQLTEEQLTQELVEEHVPRDQAGAIAKCLRFGNQRADIDDGNGEVYFWAGHDHTAAIENAFQDAKQMIVNAKAWVSAAKTAYGKGQSLNPKFLMAVAFDFKAFNEADVTAALDRVDSKLDLLVRGFVRRQGVTPKQTFVEVGALDGPCTTLLVKKACSGAVGAAVAGGNDVHNGVFSQATVGAGFWDTVSTRIMKIYAKMGGKVGKVIMLCYDPEDGPAERANFARTIAHESTHSFLTTQDTLLRGASGDAIGKNSCFPFYADAYAWVREQGAMLLNMMLGKAQHDAEIAASEGDAHATALRQLEELQVSIQEKEATKEDDPAGYEELTEQLTAREGAVEAAQQALDRVSGEKRAERQDESVQLWQGSRLSYPGECEQITSEQLSGSEQLGGSAYAYEYFLNYFPKTQDPPDETHPLHPLNNDDEPAVRDPMEYLKTLVE